MDVFIGTAENCTRRPEARVVSYSLSFFEHGLFMVANSLRLRNSWLNLSQFICRDVSNASVRCKATSTRERRRWATDRLVDSIPTSSNCFRVNGVFSLLVESRPLDIRHRNSSALCVNRLRLRSRTSTNWSCIRPATAGNRRLRWPRYRIPRPAVYHQDKLRAVCALVAFYSRIFLDN